jgi:predicted kinase
MIIIVFGLPGSGKSFFATRLAKKLNAGYLSSDQLRKEMFSVRTYSLKEKMAVYDTMRMAMKEAVKNKIDLVLDGSFYKESIRKQFKDDIREKQALWFIEVIADESVIQDRLSKPRAFSEADFEVYKKIKAEWEPMKENRLIIPSTNDTIQEMLKKAEDYLPARHDKK